MKDKPKFCTKCGYTLTTSTNFCANCGRKIDEIPEKEKPSISQEDFIKKYYGGKILDRIDEIASAEIGDEDKLFSIYEKIKNAKGCRSDDIQYLIDCSEELDKKGTELPTNKKKISRALLGDDPSSFLYTKGTSGFYGKRNTGKRKIAIAIIIPIMFILLVGSIMSSDDEEGLPAYVDPPPGAGVLGGEHEHASLLVRIFGDKFDFTSPDYQIKSSWIHFEESDGTTIHRHSSGVNLGYLFDSINIGIDYPFLYRGMSDEDRADAMSKKCFIFPDGRQFCTNEDYSLKFYVNRNEIHDLYSWVIEEGDRILITYGGETHEQIKEQLRELDLQVIKG